ncbi:MAG: FtsB family cell division protein [Candidatus Adiutrix sp.]
MTEFSGKHGVEFAKNEKVGLFRRIVFPIFSFFWGGLKGVLNSRWLILALGVFLFFIYLLLADGGLMKHRELESQKMRLEAEIENLQDENRTLRVRLERLNSDPAYVEDEARKKLGLIRPGETVYRLAEETDLLENNKQNP